jgi:RND family efflux transporter MFP subunit
MHRPNPKRIVPLVIVVLLLAGGYYLYSTGSLPLGSAAAANDQNVVSGFIEGDQVNVASEVSGRIAAIAVNEGDRVTAGQAIVQLDHSLLDAQIAQAQAAVNTAQAQLAQIQNGPRASDVTAAQAALAAAQQNYDKLRAGATASDLAAAQAALAAAEQSYSKVRAGPTADQLGQLKAQVDNAQAALDQAQSAYDKIGGATNPYIELSPQSLQLQQATNNYNAAVAAYNDARTHPTAADLAAAQAQVQQAQAALDRLTPDAAQLAAAQAQVQQAQAALDRLTPTADQIAVAEDQVKQAKAALAVLQTQLAKMTLTSPVNGIVAQRAVNVGEFAAPGAALLTITKLDPVKLTIYVPETQLGQIKLGEQIGVQVDSFPEQVFKGQVIFISPQAEFTPRNVQTKAERVNTVFAVKLQIPNPDAALKPGMPADATLE